MSLLAELERQTARPDLFLDIEAALAKGLEGDGIPAAVRAKAEEALRRAMTLDSRTGIMKALADSLGKVVSIEREAFGLDDDNAAKSAQVRVVVIPAKDSAS